MRIESTGGAHPRLLYAVGLAMLLTQAAGATPEIQHWVTAEGMDVYLVETSELPIIDVRVVVDAGSARDGDMPGLATITGELLDQGAAGKSAQDIAYAFDANGARYGTQVGNDYTVLSLRSLLEYFAPALDNLVDVAGAPGFEDAALDRVRRRLLVGIEARDQDPGALAEYHFYRALYGAHPYGAPAEGEQESVAAIDRDAVQEFYRRHYTADGARLVMVGALDREQAEQVAARLSTALPAGAAPPPLPEVGDAGLDDARELGFYHPSVQTHILIGHLGIRVNDPRRLALYVGNHVLGGGGMVNRLFDEVREQRGLAYSVYSYFLPRSERGPFIAGMQTRGDQAQEAIQLLKAELERMREEGPTAAELEQAKSNITGGFPLRIDSNAELANYLVWLGYHRMPLDYMHTFQERIRAVSLEDVRAALQAHLHPGNLLTVTVGSSAASQAAD